MVTRSWTTSHFQLSRAEPSLRAAFSASRWRRVAGGAQNYGRDGAMRIGRERGRRVNYEPNSFDGPRQTGEPLYAGIAGGVSGSYAPVRHAEDDDFVQAGMLYRVMAEDERERLVANLAGSLTRVSRDDIIERSLAHFCAADPEYGARVEAAVKALRG